MSGLRNSACRFDCEGKESSVESDIWISVRVMIYLVQLDSLDGFSSIASDPAARLEAQVGSVTVKSMIL